MVKVILTNVSFASPGVVAAVTGRDDVWTIGEVALGRVELAMTGDEVALICFVVAMTGGELALCLGDVGMAGGELALTD